MTRQVREIKNKTKIWGPKLGQAQRVPKGTANAEWKHLRRKKGPRAPEQTALWKCKPQRIKAERQGEEPKETHWRDILGTYKTRSLWC